MIALIKPDELASKIKQYYFNVNAEEIKKAYIFSLDNHGGALRDSGELFFTHPLAVANILTDLKMDPDSIIAALLHDIVEDTDVTYERVAEEFGESVARIVNGVTKISGFESISVVDNQIENYKKLLLSSAQDARVLIIKLADRLHNIMTLQYKAVKKRARIARETLYIYAPLAERMGLGIVKSRLQNYAFKELYPDSYNVIVSRLAEVYNNASQIIDVLTNDLKMLAINNGIVADIIGRVKTPYSVWHKINHRGMLFDQIADVIALRVIVDNVQQCYQMLGVIHREYCIIHGRFKDYISDPKKNNYQSIHTSIMGPFNNRIEIQIRTHDMHRAAEYGLAAHWNYKSGGESNNDRQWLFNLADTVNSNDMQDMSSFANNASIANYVFCITPNGKIVQLTEGATALDFAYAIHSDVGAHAIAAKIDDVVKPLGTRLESGMVVNIITDSKKEPNPEDAKIIFTAKARAGLQKALNHDYVMQNTKVGRTMLHDYFSKRGAKISDKELAMLASHFNRGSINGLFRAIADFAVSLDDAFSAYNGIQDDRLARVKIVTKILPVIGIPENTAVIATQCCMPVPGDIVAGFVVEDGYIDIHADYCANAAANMKTSRIIDLQWADDAFGTDTKYLTKISVLIDYEPGMVNKIVQIIARNHAKPEFLQIEHRHSNKILAVYELYVYDAGQVNRIIAEIKNECNTAFVDR